MAWVAKLLKYAVAAFLRNVALIVTALPLMQTLVSLTPTAIQISSGLTRLMTAAERSRTAVPVQL